MGKAIRWHNILDSHNPKYNGVEKYSIMPRGLLDSSPWDHTLIT